MTIIEGKCSMQKIRVSQVSASIIQYHYKKRCGLFPKLMDYLAVFVDFRKLGNVWVTIGQIVGNHSSCPCLLFVFSH